MQLQGTWFICVSSKGIPQHRPFPGTEGCWERWPQPRPAPAPLLVCGVLLITQQRGCWAAGSEGSEVNTWKCLLVFPLGDLPVAPRPSHPARLAAGLGGWRGALGEPSLGKSDEEQGKGSRGEAASALWPEGSGGRMGPGVPRPGSGRGAMCCPGTPCLACAQSGLMPSFGGRVMGPGGLSPLD